MELKEALYLHLIKVLYRHH